MACVLVFYLHTPCSSSNWLNHTCLFFPSWRWSGRMEGWVGLGGWLHTEIYVWHWELNPDMVTHPNTNRARFMLTSLIETNVLLLCQTTTIYTCCHFAVCFCTYQYCPLYTLFRKNTHLCFLRYLQGKFFRLLREFQGVFGWYWWNCLCKSWIFFVKYDIKWRHIYMWVFFSEHSVVRMSVLSDFLSRCLFS